MKTTNRLICIGAVAAFIGAGHSNAQSLTAHFISIDPGIGVNGTVDNGSFTQDWASGVAKFQEFNAFCIEPAQSLDYGETLVYQIQNPLSLDDAADVASLVGGYLEYLNTNPTSGAIAQNAAAVQWAIWEVTTEVPFATRSLDIGKVRITAPDPTGTNVLANQYLANIGTYTPANVTFLTNSTRQDVVTWNNVPEPTSAALLALSGLLLFRRRR